MDGDGGMDTYSYVCMGIYGRDGQVGLRCCLLFVVRRSLLVVVVVLSRPRRIESRPLSIMVSHSQKYNAKVNVGRGLGINTSDKR